MEFHTDSTLKISLELMLLAIFHKGKSREVNVKVKKKKTSRNVFCTSIFLFKLASEWRKTDRVEERKGKACQPVLKVVPNEKDELYNVHHRNTSTVRE